MTSARALFEDAHEFIGGFIDPLLWTGVMLLALAELKEGRVGGLRFVLGVGLLTAFWSMAMFRQPVRRATELCAERIAEAIR